ncbi:hypothetical protein DAPPUDRAFT_328430 [Daphnia pulex]|uniref:Uncharacterized protein n=1 Tax=Daphnia pulex TaxID=6669 RepID=E9HDN9_DAPPU|nr:hypothetical protein DAPPUDRAFT_328430 [Daphnia pulex]|eukprot:EFX70185.1 hypothetical protein DAPPUDRAFT_328430 [Daphnia pulex]
MAERSKAPVWRTSAKGRGLVTKKARFTQTLSSSKLKESAVDQSTGSSAQRYHLVKEILSGNNK